MRRYREKTSTFLTKFAYGLSGKQCPASGSLSKSPRPAPQTSLSTSSYVSSSVESNPFHHTLAVLELPDELVLSILSHVSPGPQHISHYARFRIQHTEGVTNHHQQRVEFLRLLSETCWAMRLRFLPWIWERIEASHTGLSSGEFLARKFNILVKARADPSPATSVKYLYTLFLSISWG